MKAGAKDAIKFDKGTQASKNLNKNLFSFFDLLLPFIFFLLVVSKKDF